MSSQPADVVRRFIARMGESTDADIAAFWDFLTEDVVWDTGTQIRTGREDACEHLRTAQRDYGVATWTADLLHVAADGDVVLTERIDHVFTPERVLIGDLKVMGTFEVSDDRISAWRDYYDPSTLVAAVQAARSATS